MNGRNYKCINSECGDVKILKLLNENANHNIVGLISSLVGGCQGGNDKTNGIGSHPRVGTSTGAIRCQIDLQYMQIGNEENQIIQSE